VQAVLSVRLDIAWEGAAMTDQARAALDAEIQKVREDYTALEATFDQLANNKRIRDEHFDRAKKLLNKCRFEDEDDERERRELIDTP
jgi:hypothetical protein